MKTLFVRLLKDESGATAIEYSLLAALISIALVAGATAVGNQVGVTFDSLSTTLSSANTHI